MSGRRFAGGANQPIRLFQNVGIFRLFSRKEAERDESRAKQHAYQHNPPVGASVSSVKRTRHIDIRPTRIQRTVTGCWFPDGFAAMGKWFRPIAAGLRNGQTR
jgi:hypothetical protein